MAGPCIGLVAILVMNRVALYQTVLRTWRERCLQQIYPLDQIASILAITEPFKEAASFRNSGSRFVQR
jgi:hypothetical protein